MYYQTHAQSLRLSITVHITAITVSHGQWAHLCLASLIRFPLPHQSPYHIHLHHHIAQPNSLHHHRGLSRPYPFALRASALQTHKISQQILTLSPYQPLSRRHVRLRPVQRGAQEWLQTQTRFWLNLFAPHSSHCSSSPPPRLSSCFVRVVSGLVAEVWANDRLGFSPDAEK